jgi:hypothetical protein
MKLVLATMVELRLKVKKLIREMVFVQFIALLDIQL